MVDRDDKGILNYILENCIFAYDELCRVNKELVEGMSLDSNADVNHLGAMNRIIQDCAALTLRSCRRVVDLRTEIVSRQIPPDIYEYLKQAKSEEDIERLSDKVKFLEKPYLKLVKPLLRQGSGGQAEVVIGIEKYVLYDFPLGSGKKADEDREELMRLVKDNFAILIDYWAVDWDYDGLTFKSQWQDLRGLGRKTKVVTTKKEYTYEKSGKHTIAVRVVDIFGNDATATMDVKL